MAEDKRMMLRENDRKGLSPFGLWNDMDEIFDSFRRDIDSMFWNPWDRRIIRPFRARIVNNYMPMNMKDTGEALELSIEIPGINKDEIKLSIEEDMLTISVDSTEDKEEKEEGYLLRERSSYSCNRTVRLPSEVKEEEVEARMEEGILHVTLPKVHPVKKEKREIEIK